MKFEKKLLLSSQDQVMTGRVISESDCNKGNLQLNPTFLVPHVPILDPSTKFKKHSRAEWMEQDKLIFLLQEPSVPEV